MSNDLISREAAIDEARDIWCRDCHCATSKRDCKACNVGNLINRLREIPAVDAAPVMHGRWIKKPFLLGTTNVCDKCGEYYGMPHGMFNYCPNCGAKMDREECMDAERDH